MSDLYQAMMVAAQQAAKATEQIAVAKAQGNQAALSAAQESQARAAMTAQVIYNTAMSPQAPASVQTAVANTVVNGGDVMGMNLQPYQTQGMGASLEKELSDRLSARDSEATEGRTMSTIMTMLARLVDMNTVQESQLKTLNTAVTGMQMQAKGSPLWQTAERPSFNVPHFLIQATADKDIEVLTLLYNAIDSMEKNPLVAEMLAKKYGFENLPPEERDKKALLNALLEREEAGEFREAGGLKRILKLMEDPSKAMAVKHRMGLSDFDWQKIISKLVACGVSAVLMGATGNFPVAAMGYFAADGLLEPSTQKLMYNGTLVDSFMIGGHALKPIGLEIPGLPNEIFFEHRYVCFDQISGKIYPSDEIRPLNYQGGTFRWVCIDRLDGSMFHANYIKKPRIYLD